MCLHFWVELENPPYAPHFPSLHSLITCGAQIIESQSTAPSWSSLDPKPAEKWMFGHMGAAQAKYTALTVQRLDFVLHTDSFAAALMTHY